MPSKKKRVKILCSECNKDHTAEVVRGLARTYGMSTASIHEIMWEDCADGAGEPRVELEGAYAVRVE